VWAREEYAAALRAQGRQPETNPWPFPNTGPGGPSAKSGKIHPPGSALAAKKCWLMLGTPKCPTTRPSPFCKPNPHGCAAAGALGRAAHARPRRNLGRRQMGKSRRAFILLVYVSLYSAANVAFFICDLLPLSGLAGHGGHWRRRLAGLRRGTPPPALARAIWLAAGMALMVSISLPNWFGAKLPSFARDYLFRSIAGMKRAFPRSLKRH